MVRLIEKFRIRAKRSGLSVSVLAVLCIGIIGLSAGISGLEGVLFTLAIALAYLLGTATQTDAPFHLRSLATAPLDRPVSRSVFEARIAQNDDTPPDMGQSLCIVLAIDSYGDLAQHYGHQGMQKLVTRLGTRLYSEIRQNDCLTDMGEGRLAIYMPPNPRIDLENAVQMTMRLHAASARPLALDRLKIRLTTCIGFCISQRLPTEKGAPNLLRAAETALAAAQKDGPRTVRAFDHAMLKTAARPTPKSDPKLDILRALDAGEIKPWFQPQICTDTGVLTGVEALVRWHHPERGILPPAVFLPSLQAQGLSVKLSETMIDQTVAQLCHWDSVGIHIPRASVNLSIDDLDDPALVDRIKWHLDRHALPPERLGIEVLETVVAQADGDDMTTRNLLALGKLGCLIDLDDFGTGSASINSIRRFAVNRIKIDRILVTAVDTDPDQHAMIAAILTMATQLGVDVLAKGVETPGEHSALAQLGCAHVQGNAIARPMPAADLLAWVLRSNVALSPPNPPLPGLPSGKTLRRNAPLRGFGGKTA